MRYDFVEVDGTDWDLEIPITLSSKFKIGPSETTLTAGITIKYDPKDDLLGQSIIEYCDYANLPSNSNNTYNTGSILFRVYEGY